MRALARQHCNQYKLCLVLPMCCSDCTVCWMVWSGGSAVLYRCDRLCSLTTEQHLEAKIYLTSQLSWQLSCLMSFWSHLSSLWKCPRDPLLLSLCQEEVYYWNHLLSKMKNNLPDFLVRWFFFPCETGSLRQLFRLLGGRGHGRCSCKQGL